MTFFENILVLARLEPAAAVAASEKGFETNQKQNSPKKNLMAESNKHANTLELEVKMRQV